MDFSECGLWDQIFTHVDPDTGAVMHINASAMLRAVPAAIAAGTAQHLRMAIDPEFVDFVKKGRGIEEHHLPKVKENTLDEPLLGVWMPDESCLTVDGHHRIVARHHLGLDYADIIILNNSCLAHFLVTNMPDGLSDMLTEEVGK